MEIVRCSPDRFDGIVALFKQYDFAVHERPWFEWKHISNPFGPSRVYELRYEGRLAGTVAVMTQPYRHRERRLLGIQAVDGLMGQEIRGKHLFNDVMTFVRQVLPEEAASPCFHLGFAQLPGSARALQNAGWRRLARFHVSKVVLGPGAVPSHPLHKRLGVILAPLWPLFRVLYATRTAGVVVRPVKRFNSDMDRFQPGDRVHGDRSAAFLNWRVIDNVQHDMKAFTFHRGPELLGYAVCQCHPNTWDIVELRTNAPGRACAAGRWSKAMREGLDHWPFVLAAYVLGLAGTSVLVGWAWWGMRRAEARRERSREQ